MASLYGKTLTLHKLLLINHHFLYSLFQGFIGHRNLLVLRNGKQTSVHNLIILDESGSMQTIKKTIIEGLSRL